MFKSVSSRYMLVLSFLLSVFAVPAMAAGPDFGPLTDAVDFSTVIAAILAIAALVAGVYVVMAGAKKILYAIRSS